MSREKAPILNTPQPLLDAMKQILSWSESDVPKVPEQMFIEHMLPKLTNTQEKQDLSWWLRLAGSLQRPIDIVSDNNPNEVLFRVPPLQRSTVLRLDQLSRSSIYEIVHVTRQKDNVIPGHGQRFLTNVMAGRVTAAPFNPQDLADWNAILKRYGLPPVGAKAETEVPADDTPVAAPKLQNEDFSGEYDDL